MRARQFLLQDGRVDEKEAGQLLGIFVRFVSARAVGDKEMA